MIIRAHRFHGHASLRYVYRNGQTVRGPVCALKYVVNERRKAYRLAVVVSKKVSKSAVQRNRIRRRLYELIRLREQQITKPYDIVITVFHENIATMPAVELSSVLDSQLEQAGIIAS